MISQGTYRLVPVALASGARCLGVETPAGEVMICDFEGSDVGVRLDEDDRFGLIVPVNCAGGVGIADSVDLDGPDIARAIEFDPMTFECSASGNLVSKYMLSFPDLDVTLVSEYPVDAAPNTEIYMELDDFIVLS